MIRGPESLRAAGLGALIWTGPTDEELLSFAAELGISGPWLELAQESVRRHREKENELEAEILPKLNELAGPASPFSKPGDHEGLGPIAAAQSFHALRVKLLDRRASLESDVVLAIAALAEQAGTIDVEEIAVRRSRFEQARWRLRCSEITLDLPVARLDLALLARAVCEPEWESTHKTEVRELVESYWREITPLSVRAVQAEHKLGARISDVWMNMRELPIPERKSLQLEYQSLWRERHSPAYERARLNREWVPRFAALMSESDAREFSAAARAIMFPRLLGDRPEGRSRGQKAVRDALGLDGLSAEQMESLTILRDDLDRRIELIDRRIEDQFMKIARRISGLDGATGPIVEFDEQIAGLILQRDKIQAEAIAMLTNHIPPEQLAKIAIELPPLGADETIMIAPGPDGAPVKRRVKLPRPESSSATSR